jgi:hypothetical protein
MTLHRVWMPSPNYSSRGDSVRLIVVHTAEGALTYQSLGNYFASSSSGVSSHVGIDDTPGTVGEYVHREWKAWTQAGANPVAVAAELCAFAAWSTDEWRRHPEMLVNCAAWIAEEAAHYGLPIIKLSPGEAQGGRLGVCAHSDLGAWGGNHSDPGPGFPWDVVIDLALEDSQPTPPPAKQEDDNNMVLTDPETGGVWVVADATGGIYAYDRAPFLGGTNNRELNAAGHRCVGISDFRDGHGAGYILTLDWGDRGDGMAADGGDRFRRYRFPRDGSARV